MQPIQIRGWEGMGSEIRLSNVYISIRATLLENIVITMRKSEFLPADCLLSSASRALMAPSFFFLPLRPLPSPFSRKIKSGTLFYSIHRRRLPSFAKRCESRRMPQLADRGEDAVERCQPTTPHSSHSWDCSWFRIPPTSLVKWSYF